MPTDDDAEVGLRFAASDSAVRKLQGNVTHNAER